MLDELDKELTRRGHRFCRYADDCNIYVRSRRAGERVMASVSRFLSKKLWLTVNEAKSAVARPEERKFLAACRTGVYRMVARIFCHAASNGEIDRIGAAAGTGHHQQTGYG